MMSYVFPTLAQPKRLELICQDFWLSLCIDLIKRLQPKKDYDKALDPNEEPQSMKLRHVILSDYLDSLLPLRIQEPTFHKVTWALRFELDLNNERDLFPTLFEVFWRKGFKDLDLPLLRNEEDRERVLWFLISDDEENGSTPSAESANFRLFDKSSLSIYESYLIKRTLRNLPYLRHVVLWKFCDDAMLSILGHSRLESLDLWRSINVSDSGILGLLSQGKQESLKRIVLRDTSVTINGALDILLQCLSLESLDIDRGDEFAQGFYGQIFRLEEKKSFALRSLFLPLFKGTENAGGVLRFFPQLEELIVWISCPYLKYFQQPSLPGLKTLKLGGLHSPRVHSLILRSVGAQLTSLHIEAMHTVISLFALGQHCPNLRKLNLLNASIHSSHNCQEDIKGNKPFQDLKTVYFSLVQYTDTERSALTCLLSHAIGLEGIQAPGSKDLNDECLERLIQEVNPLLSLRRFMLTTPFNGLSTEPKLPLGLTSASLRLLSNRCPLIGCIGDLRCWDISLEERMKLLLKRSRRLPSQCNIKS